MGFGDKFKDLASKAQEAVVEHKDQISGAVDRASVLADQKTGGKYRDKIHKFGAKANESLDKLSDQEGPEGAAPAPAPGSAAATEPAAPPANPQPATPPPPPDDSVPPPDFA